MEQNEKTEMDNTDDTRSFSHQPLQRTIVATLVVISVFINNVLVFGFIAVLPVYLVQFKKVFPENYDIVLLIIFLPSSSFGIVGFLTGMFITKFGTRITGILGSLFLALPIGAPFYSSNAFVVLACFAIFPGVGCSFLNMSSSYGLAAYLGEERRKFVPFTTTGKALGYIIFPILGNFYIEIMFWRGSLLLLAATLLQTLPCAFMFSTNMYKNMKTNNVAADSNRSLQNNLSKSHSNFESCETIKMEISLSDIEICPERNTSLNDESNVNEYTFQTDNKLYIIGNTRQSDTNSINAHDEINTIEIESNKRQTQNQQNQSETNDDKSDIKFSVKLKTVLTNNDFALFLIALFIVYGCVATSTTILPDYCVKQGLTRAEGAKVSSMGSIGYILACFVGTWLIHKNVLPSRIIFSIAAILTGLFTCFYPFLSVFLHLALLTVVVMFTCGIMFSLYLVLIMDIFDMEYFSVAMGFGESSIGLGILTGGYLIGLFSEYMNTYEYSYYVIGIGPILAVQPILLPFLLSKLHKQTHSYPSTDNKF